MASNAARSTVSVPIVFRSHSYLQPLFKMLQFYFLGPDSSFIFLLVTKNPLNEISYKSSLQKEINSNLKKISL